MVYQIIAVVLTFASILFLAAVAARYIGSKARKTLKGRYISIVESVSLGLDKNLYLVKVGEQFILIASAGKNIEYLTTVELDESQMEEASQSSDVFNFKNFFEKYLQVYRNKRDERGRKDDVDSGMKFADSDIAGQKGGERFKSNLDRLKAVNKKINARDKKGGDDITDEE